LKISKADFLVIAALLIVSIFAMTLNGRGEKRLYLISEDGKSEISLKDDRIELDDGDIILEVTSNGARFVKNDCPNKICISAGWVKDCGDTAACVPNKYALTMECSEVPYDAVSQ